LPSQAAWESPAKRRERTIDSNRVAKGQQLIVIVTTVLSLGQAVLAVLSDSETPSNLNACNFLTVKDNKMFNPIFGMLSSRAIQNISDMLGYLYWLKS